MIYRTYTIKQLSDLSGTSEYMLRRAFQNGDLANESGNSKYEASIESYNEWKRTLKQRTRKKTLAEIIDEY